MKRILIVLITSIIIITVGVGVAYCHTSSLGYDDTVVFFLDENKVIVFGNTVEFEKIRENVRKITEVFPDKMITI